MAKSAVDAFSTRIGTTWTSNDGTVLSVLGINDAGQSPATGAPFIEVTFPVLNERQFTIGAPGSNFYKQEGVARIVINQKRGKGLDDVLGWAERFDVSADVLREVKVQVGDDAEAVALVLKGSVTACRPH